eukprot:g3302.t1
MFPGKKNLTENEMFTLTKEQLIERILFLQNRGHGKDVPMGESREGSRADDDCHDNGDQGKDAADGTASTFAATNGFLKRRKKKKRVLDLTLEGDTLSTPEPPTVPTPSSRYDSKGVKQVTSTMLMSPKIKEALRKSTASREREREEKEKDEAKVKRHGGRRGMGSKEKDEDERSEDDVTRIGKWKVIGFWKKKEDIPQKWDDINLGDEILAGIFSLGFTEPRPIQCLGIPPAIKGFDIIAHASSGQGKTGMFAISLLDRINLSFSRGDFTNPQALVLANTRELAQQHATVIRSLCVKAAVQVCIGGDRGGIDRDVHVISGTLGRVKWLCTGYEYASQRWRDVKIICIDEADELFSRGSFGDLEDICTSIQEFVGEDRIQYIMSSATMPRDAVLEMKRIVKSDKHVTILMDVKDVNLTAIDQYKISGFKGGWEQMLATIVEPSFIEILKERKTFIFCRTKDFTDWLSKSLSKHDISAAPYHGGMAQEEREGVVRAFRKNTVRVLVTTDIGARGLDVVDVDFVVNFGLPENADDYMHRVGRCGRNNRTGVAVNFVDDEKFMETIQKRYCIKIGDVPAIPYEMFI